MGAIKKCGFVLFWKQVSVFDHDWYAHCIDLLATNPILLNNLALQYLKILQSEIV